MTLLIVYLILAIGVSFLCSILEAVLLSISPVYTQQMNEQRPRVGKKIAEVRTNLDESISSILILNTFAHTVGAVGVGSQAIKLFGEQWESLIAVLLTLVILYVSEIIPKTIGAKYWIKLAPTACVLISWLVKLVFPLVWFSTRITSLFGNSKGHEVTREQLVALAYLGKKGGAIDSSESQYLENVLSLREVCTDEICTPRSVVHMLENTMTVNQALAEEKTKSFSRIPVFNDNADQVIGKVITRELYEAKLDGKGDSSIEAFVQDLGRVSEQLPVAQLLDRFIKQHSHMFLVEDEFGQTTGIVTLEDALETLLGREIVDESDPVEDMQALAKVKYRERLRQRKVAD